MKTYTITAISIATMALTALLTALTSPTKWLDTKMLEREQDPEAGLATLEYVVLGALLLAVVVVVAATIGDRITSWADRVPG